MPRDTVATVRQAFERWNRGDREIRDDEVDPELELHSRMLGQVVRGYQGLRAWFEEIDEQFEQWRLEIAEIREPTPDQLLVLGAVHLRGRESAVEFDQPMAWLLDFRDGRLQRMEMFVDRSEALEAAGLSE